MTSLENLDDKTWPQLKECVLVAVPALRKWMLEGSGDAMSALEKINRILSDDWEGPAS